MARVCIFCWFLYFLKPNKVSWRDRTLFLHGRQARVYWGGTWGMSHKILYFWKIFWKYYKFQSLEVWTCEPFETAALVNFYQDFSSDSIWGKLYETSLGTFIRRLIEECLKVWNKCCSGSDFSPHWFTVRCFHSENQDPIDTLRLTFSVQKSNGDFMQFFLTITGESQGLKRKVTKLC